MPNSSIPLVGLASFLRDRFGELPLRLSVLKLDVEAYEFDLLPELWRLCEAGQLVLDQLNVEMHLVVREQERPLLVRDVFSAFAGALCCGLVLHHKGDQHLHARRKLRRETRRALVRESCPHKTRRTGVSHCA